MLSHSALDIERYLWGMRRGCAGDFQGMRPPFGGCACKLLPKWMGFGGLQTSPLTPFIILKGGEEVGESPVRQVFLESYNGVLMWVPAALCIQVPTGILNPYSLLSDTDRGRFRVKILTLLWATTMLDLTP